MSFEEPSHEELAQLYLVAPAPTEELPEEEQQRLLGAKRTSYQRKKDRKQHEEEAAKAFDDADGKPRPIDPFGVEPRMAPYWKAFNIVAVNYFKLRNSSAVTVQDYEKILSDSSETIYGELGQRPDSRDFQVDVERIGRRALHDVPALLRIFDVVILKDEGVRWCDVPLKDQHAIAQRVGKAFITANLLPDNYFRVIRRTLAERRKLAEKQKPEEVWTLEEPKERALTGRGRPQVRGQFIYDRAKVQKLWRVVLYQAQVDAFSKNRRVRSNALNFLFGDGSDLAIMSQGIPNADAFRERLHKRLWSEVVRISFKDRPTFEINGREFWQKMEQEERERLKKQRRSVELKKAA